MAVKTGRIYCGRWTQRAAVTHLVGLFVNGTFVILGPIDRKEHGEEGVSGSVQMGECGFGLYALLFLASV